MLSICAVILLCAFSFNNVSAQPQRVDRAADSVAFPDLSVLSLSEASIAVSSVTMPMVVSISTPVKKNDDLRLRYLEEYLRSYGRGSRPDAYRGRSIGSGVIISEDGYILTNNHVVDGAYEDSLLVTLNDGRGYYADLVGQDERTDLALLRIYEHNLPAVAFADVEKLKIGEWVLALGSPLGLRSTVTFGIVSALNREVKSPDNDEYAVQMYIQTDAAINPGNSGGGLFNLQGELVGVNTALYSTNGFYQGYGFAIPANLARSIALDLIKDGKLDRGYLGITARDIDDTVALRLRLEVMSGAVVDFVEPKGPAGDGGLKVDDVLLRVNGLAVESLSSLKSILALYQKDERLTFDVLRGGKKESIIVVLGASNDNADEPYTVPAASLGIVSRSPKPEDDAKAGMSESRGVYIDQVERYGTASLAKIFPGDILLSVNGQKIYSTEGLGTLISSSRAGDPVSLVVWRDGAEVVRKGVLQAQR